MIQKLINEIEQKLNSDVLSDDEKQDEFKKFRKILQKDYNYVFWFQPGMSQKLYQELLLKDVKKRFIENEQSK